MSLKKNEREKLETLNKNKHFKKLYSQINVLLAGKRNGLRNFLKGEYGF